MNYIIYQMIGVKYEKNFTVITLPDNYCVSIGSACDSEISLIDPSVSPYHGNIRYDTMLDEVII